MKVSLDLFKSRLAHELGNGMGRVQSVVSSVVCDQWCNGTGSGGLPVAGWTRVAASRRRAAGRGQGRRHADGAQRGQDKGGSERSARSGDRTRAARSEQTARGEREVWERKCGSSIRKLRKQVVA